MSEEEHYHSSRLCTDSRCGCPADSPVTRTCGYCKHTASGYRHCPYCKRDYDVSPGYTRAGDPGAYHRRLMQREAALASAELRRLDEQYPVWTLGYDALDWSRQRCAYITGDDAALERMCSYVSADSPALWEAAQPARRLRFRIGDSALSAWAGREPELAIGAIFGALTVLIVLCLVVTAVLT